MKSWLCWLLLSHPQQFFITNCSKYCWFLTRQTFVSFPLLSIWSPILFQYLLSGHVLQKWIYPLQGVSQNWSESVIVVAFPLPVNDLGLGMWCNSGHWGARVCLMGVLPKKGFLHWLKRQTSRQENKISLLFQSSCDWKKSKSEDKPSYEGWQIRKVERA